MKGSNGFLEEEDEDISTAEEDSAGASFNADDGAVDGTLAIVCMA